MLNWAGSAMKMAETDFNLGKDIMNITSSYLSSKAKQLGLEIQARNYGRQADAMIETAGNIQTNARQMSEMRLVQLGQETGNINASAAGSGLDVSSQSVQKAIADTATSAWNDVRTINRNAQVEAKSAINGWLSAASNQAASKFAVKQEKMNRRWALWGGALSAAANWGKGMADSMSTLMGGAGSGGIGMAPQVGGIGAGG